jgi:hypothetical protein
MTAEVSDLVETVLNRALSCMEDHEEGDILVDWVVVAYVTNPDKEKRSGYPMLFANGEMPDYRARGLLHTALLTIGEEE